MFKRWSILSKLTLINAASALVVIVIAYALIAQVISSQLQSTFEDRIIREVEIVATTLVPAVQFEDWETATELLASLLTDQAIIQLELTDATGLSRASVGKVDPTPVDGSTDYVGLYRQRLPILDQQIAIATISVTAVNAEIAPAVQQATRAFVLNTLIALGIGLLLTMRMQSLLVAPIIRLTGLVRQIHEAKDYRLRAEVGADDEIGRLTSGINEMLNVIERRDQDLAGKVARRTEQLEQRNADLQREMESRRFSERRLRESQQEFKRAFENAPIGMAIVHQDGALVRRNRVMDGLLELQPDSEVTLESMLRPQDKERFQSQFEQLVSGQIAELSNRYQCRTARGQLVLCDLSISTVADEDGGLRYLVLQLQDVTESARLADELEHLASHDALTGLANRRQFEVELRRALRRLVDDGELFSLALIDLDQFKVVNDVCGHAAGDALLIKVAEFIRESVRPDDLVVRLGGDEFAVLLFRCAAEDARVIAERIRRQVENSPFYWEDNNFRVGASIGLLTVTDPSFSASHILKQVDAACYAAKDLGRNQVYQVAENDALLARHQGEMHWVGRIHRALDEDLFVLFAQDIRPISANAGGDKHREILIRLQEEPGSRLIPPGAFLPSVERYNLSVRVDRWVITSLIRHLKALPELVSNHQAYWINLSGTSLGDRNFLSDLELQIAEAGLPPGAINFEVTETSVIRNMEAAGKCMWRLKNFGCRFALDDFGTGLSSFGYLRDLPVDTIKIDGTFVRNMVNDSIDRIFVGSIIEMARALKIRTVAEFVESDAIADVLRELGADYGQGFALHKPEALVPGAAQVVVAEVDLQLADPNQG